MGPPRSPHEAPSLPHARGWSSALPLPVPQPPSAASPATVAALTTLGFARFWLRGLWFFIHHSSQRLQGRELSGAAERAGRWGWQWGAGHGARTLGRLQRQGTPALTFFLSSCPFFRSLLAIMTPVRRVSNTGSLLLAAAGARGWREGFRHGVPGAGASRRGDGTYRAGPWRRWVAGHCRGASCTPAETLGAGREEEVNAATTTQTRGPSCAG